MDKLTNIGKQSGECVESVLKVTKHSAPFKCMKPMEQLPVTLSFP